MSPVPKHSDAVGHLNDLAKEVNRSWFTMIFDLAAVGNKSELDDLAKANLYALFRERASYLGMKQQASSAIPPTAESRPDFLEKLSGFSGFKLLEDSLEIHFKSL